MKDTIRRAVPFLISLLTVTVLLLLQFTVLKINENFGLRELLPQVMSNALLIFTTSVVWMNSGTDRAKNVEKSAYRDNSAIFATQLKKVTDNGELSALRAFCKLKTEQMRHDKITALLANVGIDRETYDTTLCDMSGEELKNAEYPLRARIAIRRIQNGKVRIRPIKFMSLVSDSRTFDECGVNYDERADKALRIAFRVVRSLVMALVVALLALEPARDVTNIAAWALFLLKLFMIASTAVSAEREGFVRITETKNKVILRRIAFFHEFDEWAKVPRLNESPKKEPDCNSPLN